ncbi:ribosomal protein L5, partial [Athelia psychrophila]
LGESDRPTRASKVLEQLTGQTPVTSKTRCTIRAFGIRRNEKIAVHVTIRRSKAEEILDRGLKVKVYGLRRIFFWRQATLNSACRSTSIWARYDPGVDIFGMDFYAVIGRPGSRVARKRKKAWIGFGHPVKKDDTQAWFN